MIIVETRIGKQYWSVHEWPHATHVHTRPDGSIHVLQRRRFWMARELCFYPGASPDGSGRNRPVLHRIVVQP